MFKHVLVPLDGSNLALSVLPSAIKLAEMGSKITLFHVIERNAPNVVHGQPHLKNEGEAKAYLSDIMITYFPGNQNVDFHVHSSQVSDVAKSIVDHSFDLNIDLVAMCTHGQGGFRTLLFGSIAQQIVALGKSPVLLIHPSKEGKALNIKCDKLLIPLDGNPEHESGLYIAASFAKRCGAMLHLLMVIHTYTSLPGERAATARLLPGVTGAILDISTKKAENYLMEKARELDTKSLTVTTGVQRGNPATVIVQTAQTIDADLIVMGTHGKTSLDAFWSDSLTTKISSMARLPLLLVPVTE